MFATKNLATTAVLTALCLAITACPNKHNDNTTAAAKPAAKTQVTDGPLAITGLSVAYATSQDKQDKTATVTVSVSDLGKTTQITAANLLSSSKTGTGYTSATDKSGIAYSIETSCNQDCTIVGVIVHKMQENADLGVIDTASSIYAMENGAMKGASLGQTKFQGAQEIMTVLAPAGKVQWDLAAKIADVSSRGVDFRTVNFDGAPAGDGSAAPLTQPAAPAQNQMEQ